MMMVVVMVRVWGHLDGKVARIHQRVARRFEQYLGGVVHASTATAAQQIVLVMRVYEVVQAGHQVVVR